MGCKSSKQVDAPTSKPIPQSVPTESPQKPVAESKKDIPNKYAPPSYPLLPVHSAEKDSKKEYQSMEECFALIKSGDLNDVDAFFNSTKLHPILLTFQGYENAKLENNDEI